MNNTSKIGGIAIVSGVLVLVLLAFLFIFWPNFVKQSVSLKLGNGGFSAKIALNDLQRAKGLSGVKEMSADKALIMAFPYEDHWKIWMKDMNIPLDIVWLDKNKKVIYIVKNASPADSSTKIFEPKTLAKYVVEVPAGVVKDKLIDVGQVADFKINERNIK